MQELQNTQASAIGEEVGTAVSPKHRRLACVSPGAGFDLQSGPTDPDSGWDRAGKPTLAANEEQPACPALGSVAVGAENRTQAGRLCYNRLGVMPAT